MKSKLLLILAVAFLFALSAPAASRSSDKIQVVYRAQPSGEWQVFVFGVEPCAIGNTQVVYPKDPGTQPIEIECDAK